MANQVLDFNNRPIRLKDNVVLRQGVYGGFRGYVTEIKGTKVTVCVPSFDDGPDGTAWLNCRSMEVIGTRRDEDS